MYSVFQKGKMLSALLLSATLLFTSCKKDKSEDHPVLPAPKLEKFTIGDEFLSFSYNADGSLKQAIVKEEEVGNGEVITYNIAYDAQKKMSLVTSSDGEKLTPVYVNNKMEKVEVHDDANDLIGFTSYTYNGDRLASATINTSLGGPMLPLMKFVFDYNAAGNITKTSYHNLNPLTGNLEPSGYVLYEYDTKVNPLSSLSEFLKLVWFVPSANNILKETHKDAEDAIEEVVEYTYSYNGQNFPKAGTLKRTVPGQAVENETIQVQYK